MDLCGNQKYKRNLFICFFVLFCQSFYLKKSKTVFFTAKIVNIRPSSIVPSGHWYYARSYMKDKYWNQPNTRLNTFIHKLLNVFINLKVFLYLFTVIAHVFCLFDRLVHTIYHLTVLSYTIFLVNLYMKILNFWFIECFLSSLHASWGFCLLCMPVSATGRPVFLLS